MKSKHWNSMSLNPYSNGICSMRLEKISNEEQAFSLNPYSNGICSMRDVPVKIGEKFIMS